MRKPETIRQLTEAMEHCQRQARREHSFWNRQDGHPWSRAMRREDKSDRETRWRRRQQHYAMRGASIADRLNQELLG